MNVNTWERFTQRARRALSLAQEEAERLNLSSIGSEHMLAGLLREEGGIGGRVLRELGLEVALLRSTLEQLAGDPATRQPFARTELAASVKRLLENSIEEARRLNQHHISTEHLLLGLTRQQEGTVIDVLRMVGLRAEEIRRRTIKAMQEGLPEPSIEAAKPIEPRDATHRQILEQLAEIESTEGVKILYACESGSRAWGFASADSDYDVRFLYLRPLNWYLSLSDQRDVIERPLRDQIDLNGWDLHKALQLFRKSNPPLLEWLGSPIVYLEATPVAAQMRHLATLHYSPNTNAYHYLHMARGNFREYLRGEQVWTKKYFYVLRPLLAVLWIERGFGLVPTEFEALVNGLALDPALKAEIDQLLKAKRGGAELDEGPRIPLLSDFIESELARLQDIHFSFDKDIPPLDELDKLFRSTLRDVWEANI